MNEKPPHRHERGADRPGRALDDRHGAVTPRRGVAGDGLSLDVGVQAFALLEEACRRGLSVPRDLSVVGFNDLPEAAVSEPPLTTVDGVNYEKGRIAARLVLERGPPRHENLPTQLIVRRSTGPTATDAVVPSSGS